MSEDTHSLSLNLAVSLFLSLSPSSVYQHNYNGHYYCFEIRVNTIKLVDNAIIILVKKV